MLRCRQILAAAAAQIALLQIETDQLAAIAQQRQRQFAGIAGNAEAVAGIAEIAALAFLFELQLATIVQHRPRRLGGCHQQAVAAACAERGDDIAETVQLASGCAAGVAKRHQRKVVAAAERAGGVECLAVGRPADAAKVAIAAVARCGHAGERLRIDQIHRWHALQPDCQRLAIRGKRYRIRCAGLNAHAAGAFHSASADLVQPQRAIQRGDCQSAIASKVGAENHIVIFRIAADELQILAEYAQPAAAQADRQVLAIGRPDELVDRRFQPVQRAAFANLAGSAVEQVQRVRVAVETGIAGRSNGTTVRGQRSGVERTEAAVADRWPQHRQRPPGAGIPQAQRFVFRSGDDKASACIAADPGDQCGVAAGFDAQDRCIHRSGPSRVE